MMIVLWLLACCCVVPSDPLRVPGRVFDLVGACRQWSEENPALKVYDCQGDRVTFESAVIGQPAVDAIAATYQANGWTVTRTPYATEMTRGGTTVTCDVEAEAVPSTVRTRIFCFRNY